MKYNLTLLESGRLFSFFGTLIVIYTLISKPFEAEYYIRNENFISGITAVIVGQFFY